MTSNEDKLETLPAVQNQRFETEYTCKSKNCKEKNNDQVSKYIVVTNRPETNHKCPLCGTINVKD